MERDYKLFIKDILDSITLIQSYLKDITEESFYKDSKLQDAVIRRLEIIGEAARRIPRAVKQKNNEVSWDKIVDYRNFIIHSYFGASLKRIWQVANLELRELKDKMEKIKFL
jgi:uncharacterized protein with HEPN domain